MKVLMLGWEFPPFIAGGLGTACYGLTRALNDKGIDVLFVLPRPIAVAADLAGPITMAAPDYEFRHPEASATSGAGMAAATEGGAPYHREEFAHVTFRHVDAVLSPYMSVEEYEQKVEKVVREAAAAPAAPEAPARHGSASGAEPRHPAPAPKEPARISHLNTPNVPYATDLLAETERYAQLVSAIAADETYEVVHAHDWMTFPAAMAAAALKQVPFIAHVHSTEFDRNPRKPNLQIVAIEQAGLAAATQIIAVSHLTRRQLTVRYDIPPEKITVVHNAIDAEALPDDAKRLTIAKNEKIVLYLGRITAQKGPEYFLAAARKVLDSYDRVKFIMAGTGDMIHTTIELAAAMGIGHKVLFTGFLQARDVERIFKMADLYVMTSVSEPFGIAPLEAIAHDVPVIISKQAGVSEVLKSALKVDFWNTDELADKILAILKHPPLANTLRTQARVEVHRMSWQIAAEQVLEVYEGVVAAHPPAIPVAAAGTRSPAALRRH